MNWKLDKNNPCHGCKKRHVGCHANCEEYRDWKEALDKDNEELRHKKYVENYDAHAKLHDERYNKKQNIWKR